MPCLLPVMMMDVGFDLAASCTVGKKALMPLTTPKRFVWKIWYFLSAHVVIHTLVRRKRTFSK